MGSGLLWLVFHQCLTRDGDFGPSPHPFERWCLEAHGAVAFAGLWLMGNLWATHVERRWRLRRRRKTGGTLFGAMLVLILSGFLLYDPPGEAWRGATAIFHWSVGLAMPLALLVQSLVRRE